MRVMTWKYWDIVIAVVGFLIQCGLALLGLTLTQWKHKLAFGGLVLLGLVGTIVAVKRGVESADRVQAQLDKIQHNTEQPQTPPIVNVPAPVVNVPPPAPLPKAIMRFSFWPVRSQEGLVDSVSTPLVRGVVTVNLTAKNTSTVQADNGQIWIQLCDSCRFAAEPEGTTAVPGDQIVRRKRFDSLHAGGFFDSTTLKIIPPDGVSSFTIALKYACERCPAIDNEHPQKLRVNVTTQ